MLAKWQNLAHAYDVGGLCKGASRGQKAFHPKEQSPVAYLYSKQKCLEWTFCACYKCPQHASSKVVLQRSTAAHQLLLNMSLVPIAHSHIMMTRPSEDVFQCSWLHFLEALSKENETDISHSNTTKANYRAKQKRQKTWTCTRYAPKQSIKTTKTPLNKNTDIIPRYKI